MPSSRGPTHELAAQRPVADQRERGAGLRETQTRERLEQPRDVLDLDEVPELADPRPGRVPAERGRSHLPVARAEAREIDARGDDVQARPEGARDQLEPIAERLRHAHDGRGVGDRGERGARSRGSRSAFATSVPCATRT